MNFTIWWLEMPFNSLSEGWQWSKCHLFMTHIDYSQQWRTTSSVFSSNSKANAIIFLGNPEELFICFYIHSYIFCRLKSSATKCCGTSCKWVKWHYCVVKWHYCVVKWHYCVVKYFSVCSTEFIENVSYVITTTARLKRGCCEHSKLL